ncbi:hypothetical protein QZH41_015335 [Actinostola sp. cb2023]|nr:hypothetical protein QZH41_015335 [Actinostola sp. cb2023]
MAITKSTVFAVLFLVLVLSTETANLVKIHRASPRIKSKSPQENNGWFSMCRYLPDFSRLFSKNKEAWLYSIPCTFLVGLCGVFPLLVIPVESGQALKEGVTADHLRLLLSFAVGGLLGDVFLHLLPEAWSKGEKEDHSTNFYVGLWVLAGILVFLILEKVFDDDKETPKKCKKEDTKHETVQNGISHKEKDVKYGNIHKVSEMNGFTKTNGTIRKRQTSNEETLTESTTDETHEEHEPDHKVH